MRAAATILIGIALAAAASGCSSDERVAPERSTTVERLGALCETARADVEALGLPAEVGYKVIEPWAARGLALAAAIRKLEGTTDEERQLTALADELGEYYRGLQLGFAVYDKTKSSEVYAASVNRAEVFLEAAEKRALALGADECAVRPFPDR
ncbi:MAG: hypothetical protein U0R50_01690 [Gaiellales bacterium]